MMTRLELLFSAFAHEPASGSENMRPASVTIREAKADDALEIARLATELGYPTEPDEMRKRLVKLISDRTHYVAVASGEDDDHLLGWVHAEHRISLEGGARAELMGLVVDPVVRRGGIGGSLAELAEAWASRRGLTKITVRSNLVRKEAHPFYQGLGYAHEKTQHVYAKLLSPDKHTEKRRNN